VGIRLEKLVLPCKSDVLTLAMPDLQTLAVDWLERLELYQNQLFRERRHRYGRRSERRGDGAGQKDGGQDAGPKKPRDDVTKRPSERYPDAPVHVERLELPEAPKCECCGGVMTDSGMTEDSQSIGVKEKQFIVIEQKRTKYRCSGCHGSIVTTPLPARVTPGGSYSDELMVDATVSKYCDLIPMERYTKMAERGGMPDLPPQSLIQTTACLADFMGPIYETIKSEVLAANVLLADETPHRMLEGDKRTQWYLWGFSAQQRSCFFECHSTRSGDVSSEVVKASKAEVLLSDAYSGYSKTADVVNKWRLEAKLKLIITAYCNAHARRYFEAAGDSKDADYMVACYKEIYRLEKDAHGTGYGLATRRLKMQTIFKRMREEAKKKVSEYSSKSAMGRAYAYFLSHYDGLTEFLTRLDVPIDNNASERLLRSHVVGRKTWYGTHSPRGAEVAAIHFTIVESCKLNGVNPRQYYLDMIGRLHRGEEVVTPYQYLWQVLLL
jgi:transposase